MREVGIVVRALEAKGLRTEVTLTTKAAWIDVTNGVFGAVVEIREDLFGISSLPVVGLGEASDERHLSIEALLARVDELMKGARTAGSN